MSSRSRSLVAGGIGALSATVALLFAAQAGDSGADRARAPASDFQDAGVRGCRDRVEGGKLTPDRPEDTIIGPMAFMALPGTYRSFARTPDRRLMPAPGVGMPAMKAVGVLEAGARVRLVVPRKQRRWMKVIYDFPHHRGGHAVTLQACRQRSSRRARRRECGWRPDLACRWCYTQFSGGFGLDFANAPRRGRCAKLVVHVAGKEEPLTRRLFGPPPAACGRRG
jgi:hypothetical protein